MIRKSTFLLIGVLGMVSILFAQEKHQCNHKVGFDKSWISDTLDAINYRINIAVTDFENQIISGETEVDLQALVDGVETIYLELQQLTVESVFVNETPVENFTHDGMLITIPLAQAINPGEMITVKIVYSGQPFHESWGGFHWSGERAFNLGVGFESIPHNLGKTWFPCIDDFHDRAFYDIYATVEENKKAVCGGLLIEIIDNGNGTHTYHWSLSHTIPTYLASIAVGEYNVYEDVFNGVEAEIPIQIYGGSIGAIEGSFLHLKDILAIFEDKYGPYPWERVGYVSTAIGAMEHATNIAYPGFAIDGSLSYESLYAHELSHMWFGDNVTCSSAEEMWLNEGWAVYSEALYREFLYGHEEYIDYLRDNLKEILQYCHTSQGDGGNYALNNIPQEVTYGMNAYERGSTVAHSLRGYLGDEVFFDVIQAYQESYQYNYASSYDMEDFISQYTGVDVHDFFEGWVYTPGTPHYDIDSFNIQTNSKGTDVYVQIEQKHKGYNIMMDNNIVEFTIMGEAGEEFSDQILFDGKTGGKTVQIPFTPQNIYCDYHDKLMDAVTSADVVLDQAGYINSPGTFVLFEVNSIVDTAHIRIEHHWAPPDPMKTPVIGLTLSDYRYWKVYGNMSENNEVSSFFKYSVSGFLDDGLITNPDDSLVMLYRQYPWEEWDFIDFTQSGSSNSGHLILDNLQAGEYTMAVIDDSFDIPENKFVKNQVKMEIYPNPTSELLNIKSSERGLVKVHDLNGTVHDSISIDRPDTEYKLNLNHLNAGSYFLRLISDDYKTLVVKPLIIE